VNAPAGEREFAFSQILTLVVILEAP